MAQTAARSTVFAYAILESEETLIDVATKACFDLIAGVYIGNAANVIIISFVVLTIVPHPYAERRANTL